MTNPQDSRQRSVRRGAEEVWSFDTVTSPPHRPGRQDLLSETLTGSRPGTEIRLRVRAGRVSVG